MLYRDYPTRYTASDAFDADDCGDPIMIGVRAAAYQCRQHGAALVDFMAEEGKFGFNINAATLLAWLGY